MAEKPVARPPRVLVPDLATYGGMSEKREILLRKEERDHVRSRRLRDGSEVVALDGKGAWEPAVLARGGTAISLLPSKKIFSSASLPGEPANCVTVALACAEPSRVEWAIEKGTECGAAGFVLLDAERSQRAYVAALSKRIPRLLRIAEEATKQCDRTIVPFVEGPKSTEEFLGGVRGMAPFTLLLAHPAGTVEDGPVPPRRTRLLFERSEFKREGEGVPAGRDFIVAIGPEGGFAPSEISLFEEEGALRASLGPRILRLETAVVVALARLVDPG